MLLILKCELFLPYDNSIYSANINSNSIQTLCTSNTGLVSNFLRPMINNFSDETLSALHASLLPHCAHCCHPDIVFHFQKSLTAHLYLCHEVIDKSDILGFLFPVSCILYPDEINIRMKSLAMRRCTFPIKFVFVQSLMRVLICIVLYCITVSPQGQKCSMV